MPTEQPECDCGVGPQHWPGDHNPPAPSETESALSLHFYCERCNGEKADTCVDGIHDDIRNALAAERADERRKVLEEVRAYHRTGKDVDETWLHKQIRKAGGPQ